MNYADISDRPYPADFSETPKPQNPKTPKPLHFQILFLLKINSIINGRSRESTR
jgi:hypothetical protein